MEAESYEAEAQIDKTGKGKAGGEPSFPLMVHHVMSHSVLPHPSYPDGLSKMNLSSLKLFSSGILSEKYSSN